MNVIKTKRSEFPSGLHVAQTYCSEDAFYTFSTKEQHNALEVLGVACVYEDEEGNQYAPTAVEDLLRETANYVSYGSASNWVELSNAKKAARGRAFTPTVQSYSTAQYEAVLAK